METAAFSSEGMICIRLSFFWYHSVDTSWLTGEHFFLGILCVLDCHTVCRHFHLVDTKKKLWKYVCKWNGFKTEQTIRFTLLLCQCKSKLRKKEINLMAPFFPTLEAFPFRMYAIFSCSFLCFWAIFLKCALIFAASLLLYFNSFNFFYAIFRIQNACCCRVCLIVNPFYGFHDKCIQCERIFLFLSLLHTNMQTFVQMHLEFILNAINHFIFTIN